MPNFSEWIEDFSNSYRQYTEEALASMLTRLYKEYIDDDFDVNLFDGGYEEKNRKRIL